MTVERGLVLEVLAGGVVQVDGDLSAIGVEADREGAGHVEMACLLHGQPVPQMIDGGFEGLFRGGVAEGDLDAVARAEHFQQLPEGRVEQVGLAGAGGADKGKFEFGAFAEQNAGEITLAFRTDRGSFSRPRRSAVGSGWPLGQGTRKTPPRLEGRFGWMAWHCVQRKWGTPWCEQLGQVKPILRNEYLTRLSPVQQAHGQEQDQGGQQRRQQRPQPPEGDPLRWCCAAKKARPRRRPRRQTTRAADTGASVSSRA